MPEKINQYQIEELSHNESANEILLITNLKTQLNIIAEIDKTIIKLPFGNNFEVIDGNIVIHPKITPK